MRALNWKEIELCAQFWEPNLKGAQLDRIVIPERHQHPDRYVKNEWVFRFGRDGKNLAFWISLQGGAPWCSLEFGKGPKASSAATHSRFDLEANAKLQGQKLIGVRAVHRDRILILEFESARIVIILIPNRPEALFVESGVVRFSTRNLNIAPTQWIEPSSSAPDLEPRERFPTDAESFHRWLSEHQKDNEESARKLRLSSILQKKKKELLRGLAQTEDALLSADAGDPQYFANLLKANLHELVTPLSSQELRLFDFEQGTFVDYTLSKDRSPKEEMDHLFKKAKRSVRKKEELGTRKLLYLNELQTISIYEAKLAEEALDELEIALGLRKNANQSVQNTVKRSWPGRSFTSADGFEIWIGRTREENIDLTFRRAKGDDYWLHIRGTPSSHAIILAKKGKSVPLETLLDAAHLVVYFSIGMNRGKIDVDYTKRKHVKRIKGASEVFYTDQKTLVIDPDRNRINRLIGKESL